jgi:hypothetical protein
MIAADACKYRAEMKLPLSLFRHDRYPPKEMQRP